MREHIARQQDPYVGNSDSDSFVSGTDGEYASEADASGPEGSYAEKPKRE